MGMGIRKSRSKRKLEGTEGVSRPLVLWDEATWSHCHGHLIRRPTGHMTFRQKNARFWHIFAKCERTFARCGVFTLRSRFCKRCVPFGKAKEVGLLWEFAKVAQKGNSTILDTSLANYQRGEDFVSLFER
jgi:hypothetical protein